MHAWECARFVVAGEEIRSYDWGMASHTTTMMQQQHRLILAGRCACLWAVSG